MQSTSPSCFLILFACLLATSCIVETSLAFSPPAFGVRPTAIASCSSGFHNLASLSLSSTPNEAVFMPAPQNDEDDDDDDDEEEDEEEDGEVLEKLEQLGKGAAKAKRGKRKSGKKTAKKSAALAAAAAGPEEVFYEGPPAISETYLPTASILTVVGIIPAAAAWARQAWVRYKVTTRRIRVTSGIGGKDMAEIVYPDIVEIRTAKRLFGDGDMVAFLRDGARFEMRNIPNFESFVEFVLERVDPEVAAKYRSKGNVGESKF